LAAELTGKPVTLPFFPAVSIHDSGVLLRFRELFAVLEHNGTRLAQDSLVVLLLSHLLVRHADSYSAPRRLRSAHPEVLRVRDYLHEHWSRNVSLQDLAGIVDLSPYHLSRVFRDELGVPPHVYQTHLRVERAKQMLVRGHAPAEVAAATGFYDQSHFGQRFKRYVGVTPGTYAQASKTFVDAKPTHS
jgi:transcriptional regulator GlxA family with amidase domain